MVQAMLRVKNNTTSIVTLPHNDPAGLVVAALKVGVQALAKTDLAKGAETLLDALQRTPEAFVHAGTHRVKVQELQPGQEGEINEDLLLPEARAQLARMTAQGGSLTVL